MYFKNSPKKIIYSLLILFLPIAASAQFNTDEKFGKNRIQYDKFNWRMVSTAHFEIYYYDGGYTTARITAKYAEEEFNRITDLIGFAPYTKTKLLLYNSVDDLKQSNIGINQQGFAFSGQTNFFRPELEIAFTGNKYDYKKELLYRLAYSYVLEMMYGGSLKDMLRSSYLLSLPQWFVSGAANYVAEGWSLEMDDFMRDFLKQKKVPNPTWLEGEKAKWVGQSIWNYIAEKYGKENISSILNLTRIVRDEQTSILNTLGVSYERFIQDWEGYYVNQYEPLELLHIQPDDEYVLKSNKKERLYTQMVPSPNGSRLAVVENHRGKYHVKLIDTVTKKEQIILKGGYRVVNQDIDLGLPLVAWIDETEILFIADEKGELTMWTYDLEQSAVLHWTRKKKKKIHFPFSNINAIDISHNGKYLLISAEKRGQSDLYLHNLDKRRSKQITRDGYDDLQARFLPKSLDVVFSSNRPLDSLNFNVSVKDIPEVSDHLNLFIYRSKSNTLEALTESESDNIRPYPIDKNNILYLSDKRGISHLYKMNLETKKSIQLTNYLYSIMDFAMVNRQLSFVMREGKREQLFLSPLELSTPVVTNKTERQKVLDMRLLKQKKKEAYLEEQKKLKEERDKQKELERQKALANDSIQTITTDSMATLEEEKKDVEVDTDNYRFDSFSKSSRQRFLEKYKKAVNARNKGRRSGLSKPVPYESRFGVENFTSNLVVDPLRGWNLLFETSMSDVLENHKISAGMFGVLPVINRSSLYAEYQYLGKRVDFKTRYEQILLEIKNTNPASANTQINHLYTLNRFKPTVSYPFTIRSRVEVSPMFESTSYINKRQLFIPEERTNYAGLAVEYIYDNSFVMGDNMMRGTRGRIRFENHTGISDADDSFSEIYIDFRHYHELYRSLTFASRVSMGKFFGSAPKTYRLGGTANWLFPSITNNPTDVSEPVSQPLTNLMFDRFIPTVRGFNYNTWEGENFFSYNGEIRFPLLKFITNKPIRSSFFRNLQFTAFFDVGTAWSGADLLSESDRTNQVIERGEFTVEVKSYKSPFLMSHGAGVRSILFGYYLKLDVAWTIEDGYRSESPKYVISIGHDF
ncbi:hypothetical protein [Sediminitomix flava]|uniref:WD40 repeat protein n=1 Tax=Sediminitomix flava TaxID=379075 RepID=A0A315Z627_SEDFL|nr:hypothetical protein [Sediminitomix flava]PWJ39303.1 hypothetical protein BC781_106204 [Sediminitomix flava]